MRTNQLAKIRNAECKQSERAYPIRAHHLIRKNEVKIKWIREVISPKLSSTTNDGNLIAADHLLSFLQKKVVQKNGSLN